MSYFLFIFPSGPAQTNTLLLGCLATKEGALIDPGFGAVEPVLKRAKEEGFRIGKILLTHSHWDHIGELALAVEKTKAPVYVHPLDAENVRRPGSDRLPFPLPIQGVEPTHLMKEGEVIEVGELRLEVIHTPGHCRGAVCFWERKENLLISGDTLFRGTMGALHLPTAEPEKMGRSMQKLATLPPETRVIPGHGGETTIGREQPWMERCHDLDR